MNSAVIPSESLYAFSIMDLSFFRSTPITRKLFDFKFFLNLTNILSACALVKFPIVEPGKNPILGSVIFFIFGYQTCG